VSDIETDLATNRSPATVLAAGPFVRWFGVGWSLAKRHVLWAVVPLSTTLVVVFAIASVLPELALPVRPRTGFPRPVVDLWSFVGVPAGDIAALTGRPMAATFPVSSALAGLVGGAYLGGLADLMDHRRPATKAALRQYGPALAGFALVWRGLELGLAVAIDTSLLVGLALYPVVLYATYRVWATPFVLVSADGGIRYALVRAWRLSGRGGPFRSFSLWLLVLTLVLSVPLSYLALRYGLVGLTAAAVVTAPLGLTVTAASLGFVRSRLERAPAEPDRQERSDEPEEDSEENKEHPDG